MTLRPGTGWLVALALWLAPWAAPSAQGNVLVIVADDVGVDNIGAYGEGNDLPPTPNVDALAARGVLFRHVWSNPLCSPTRATIQTGRYSFRTRVGHVPPFGPALPVDELTLPEVLDRFPALGVRHAAFGKWHLGPFSGGFDNPNRHGWSHYAGNVGGSLASYYVWPKTVDGVTASVVRWAPSENVDDALAWISRQKGPWLCWLAFNAAHAPFHSPPPELHTQTLPTSLAALLFAPRPFYRAMVEAMDAEIGRLLASLAPDVLAATTVVFVGDNGTPSAVVAPPLDPLKSKATLYEGGVRVPLIVSGPTVARPGSRCDALVGTVDLFATVAELAGVDLARSVPSGYRCDSLSLVPYLRKPDRPSERAFVFAEIFQPHATAGPYSVEGRAVRDERFKYIHSSFTDPVYGSGFYDLENDPYEQSNLLKLGMTPFERKRYDVLRRAMQQLLGS
jgi:arylsulfatase A-like enzyme